MPSFRTPQRLCVSLALLTSLLSACAAEITQPERKRAPNILIAIADDAGHMGADVRWVATPSFDRVADHGLRFSNAYTPNAKCAPSRASILTGRNSWQLKEAANHFNNFPAEFKTYPEALRDLGYSIGYTGKGWGPGNAGEVDGRARELLGPSWRAVRNPPPTELMSDIDYAQNFIEFYENKAADAPFHFWYGAYEPHRAYAYGSSLAAGKALSDIDAVPGYFPDNDIVRTDLLDYALEIEHFDTHLGKILEYLEAQGELDNTLVIVTSDHGMPFPRAKSDEYEASNHVPLAMMFGRNIKQPGRVINDYVSLIDLAPTIFASANFAWEQTGMQTSPGISLLPFLHAENSSRADFVLIGKERHDVGRPDDYGYPIRGIVRDGWMYLRNYRPDLWPAGNPETGYSTVDASPTKSEVLKARHLPASRHLWELSFGKRAGEELYRVTDDPDCLVNLAEDSAYTRVKNELRNTMETELKRQGDPRMFGNGDVFHRYFFTWDRVRNYYQRRIVEGEDLVPPWIDVADIETDLMQ